MPENIPGTGNENRTVHSTELITDRVTRDRQVALIASAVMTTDADAVARQPWAAQAASVLWTAADGNWSEAHRQLQELNDEHGSEIIPNVMVAWAITTMHYSGIDQDPDRVMGMMFVNAATGETNDVDNVPPPIRWAGRFLIGVATRDTAQVGALVDSVTSDEEFSDVVAGLLNVCGSVLGRVVAGTYLKD